MKTAIAALALAFASISINAQVLGPTETKTEHGRLDDLRDYHIVVKSLVSPKGELINISNYDEHIIQSVHHYWSISKAIQLRDALDAAIKAAEANKAKRQDVAQAQ